MDKELEEAVKLLKEMKNNCINGDYYDDKARYYKAEAIEKVLNYIDNSIHKDKIKEVLKDLNSEAIEIEKDFDAIYKKENKDMQDFYTTRDLTNQLQMISWFEGILEEVLEEKECKK